MKLQLWLITQSKILNWAMSCSSADCCCCALTQLLCELSSRIWELCSNDIQEQGPSFLFNLPSQLNNVSTQQDKLTELGNILQHNASKAANYPLLGRRRKKKTTTTQEIEHPKQSHYSNLTTANTERCSQIVLVLPLPLHSCWCWNQSKYQQFIVLICIIWILNLLRQSCDDGFCVFKGSKSYKLLF